MLNTGYLLLVTASLFAMTLTTRALPFIFTRQMKDNHLVQYLGKHLPSAIIFLLAIYYVMSIAEPSHWKNLPYQLIAIVLVILCQWRWRKLMVSLIVGTVTYILLNSFLL